MTAVEKLLAQINACKPLTQRTLIAWYQYKENQHAPTAIEAVYLEEGDAGLLKIVLACCEQLQALPAQWLTQKLLPPRLRPRTPLDCIIAQSALGQFSNPIALLFNHLPVARACEVGATLVDTQAEHAPALVAQLKHTVKRYTGEHPTYYYAGRYTGDTRYWVAGAKSNNPECQYALAMDFMTRTTGDAASNLYLAGYWFYRATQHNHPRSRDAAARLRAGHTTPRFAYFYAHCQLQGHGCETNAAAATTTLARLTQEPAAQITLARCYASGYGVRQNRSHAQHILKQVFASKPNFQLRHLQECCTRFRDWLWSQPCDVLDLNFESSDAFYAYVQATHTANELAAQTQACQTALDAKQNITRRQAAAFIYTHRNNLRARLFTHYGLAPFVHAFDYTLLISTIGVYTQSWTREEGLQRLCTVDEQGDCFALVCIEKDPEFLKQCFEHLLFTPGYFTFIDALLQAEQHQNREQAVRVLLRALFLHAPIFLLSDLVLHTVKQLPINVRPNGDFFNTITFEDTLEGDRCRVFEQMRWPWKRITYADSTLVGAHALRDDIDTQFADMVKHDRQWADYALETLRFHRRYRTSQRVTTTTGAGGPAAVDTGSDSGSASDAASATATTTTTTTTTTAAAATDAQAMSTTDENAKIEQITDVLNALIASLSPNPRLSRLYRSSSSFYYSHFYGMLFLLNHVQSVNDIPRCAQWLLAEIRNTKGSYPTSFKQLAQHLMCDHNYLYALLSPLQQFATTRITTLIQRNPDSISFITLLDKLIKQHANPSGLSLTSIYFYYQFAVICYPLIKKINVSHTAKRGRAKPPFLALQTLLNLPHSIVGNDDALNTASTVDASVSTVCVCLEQVIKYGDDNGLPQHYLTHFLQSAHRDYPAWKRNLQACLAGLSVIIEPVVDVAENAVEDNAGNVAETVDAAGASAASM